MMHTCESASPRSTPATRLLIGIGSASRIMAVLLLLGHRVPITTQVMAASRKSSHCTKPRAASTSHLVVAALPGTAGISEVHLEAGFDCDLLMVGEFHATVPGKALA